MATTAGASLLVQSYDDFEPYCNWQREEGHDTLVIHLPEFKKNQLKVQINNLGVLTISGERPVNETKRSRFSKQIKLAKSCNTSEIHAKFVGGLLYITMPKKTSLLTTLDQPATSLDDHQPPSKENETPKSETISQDKSPQKPKVDSLGSTGGTMIKSTSNKDMGNTSLVKRPRILNKKVAVSFAVAVAAMVAIGAYLSYKYQSSHADNY